MRGSPCLLIQVVLLLAILFSLSVVEVTERSLVQFKKCFSPHLGQAASHDSEANYYSVSSKSSHPFASSIKSSAPCCQARDVACILGDTASTLERGRIDGAPASDDKTGRRSSFSKLNFPHNNPVTLRKRYSIF